MPPTLKFSVTPLNPVDYTYDRVAREYSCKAFLRFFGVEVFYGYPRRLRDQYNQDKIYFGTGAAIDSPAPTTLPSDYPKYALAMMHFRTDATIQNQYLLKYYLKGSGGAKVAFYLNRNHVGSVQVDGDEEIDIQVDCPPPHTVWYAHMLMEGRRGYLELKKIECYIL